jgi:hypothetical protein
MRSFSSRTKANKQIKKKEVEPDLFANEYLIKIVRVFQGSRLMVIGDG